MQQAFTGVKGSANGHFHLEPPKSTTSVFLLLPFLQLFALLLSFTKRARTKMSNKSPIFPMPEPQHFSDYGFDPQINYYQVLEEARKHKKEASSRSIDSLHFKLQKPISKEESKSKKSTKKKRWWKNALLFFKWKWIHNTHQHDLDLDHDVHHARARAFRASISGPVYITESRSGSSTPYRTTSRPSSGPLAGTLTPVTKGDVQVPYLSLRELNMEQQQQRMSTSSVPIYLVT